jgi:hypothetical protein
VSYGYSLLRGKRSNMEDFHHAQVCVSMLQQQLTQSPQEQQHLQPSSSSNSSHTPGSGTHTTHHRLCGTQCMHIAVQNGAVVRGGRGPLWHF